MNLTLNLSAEDAAVLDAHVARIKQREPGATAESVLADRLGFFINNIKARVLGPPEQILADAVKTLDAATLAKVDAAVAAQKTGRLDAVKAGGKPGGGPPGGGKPIK